MACLPFEFDVTLIRRSSGEAPEERRFVYRTSFCAQVRENNDLTDFRIEPSSFTLPTGASRTVAAIDNKTNQSLKVSTGQVKFDLDPLSPPLVTVTEQKSEENALVKAVSLVAGTAVVRALATTAPSGFALLPSPDLIFEVDSFVLAGQKPRGGKKATATVETKKTVKVVQLDPPGVLLGKKGFLVTIGGEGFAIDDDPTVEPVITVSGKGVTVEAGEFNALQIKAFFDVEAGAEPGERDLTVEVGGVKSNPFKFLVRAPAALKRSPFPTGVKSQESDEVGVGKLVVLFGNTVDVVRQLDGMAATKDKQCGVYRNLAYELVDRRGEAIEAPYMISEEICVVKSTSQTGGVNTDIKNSSVAADSVLPDTVGLFRTATDGCPAPGTVRHVMQRFVVKFAGRDFPLRTVNKAVTTIDPHDFTKSTVEVTLMDNPAPQPVSRAMPKITSFTPEMEEPGKPVTINGENFDCVKAVSFSSMEATSTSSNAFVVNSPTMITATVPPDAIDGRRSASPSAVSICGALRTAAGSASRSTPRPASPSTNRTTTPTSPTPSHTC